MGVLDRFITVYGFCKSLTRWVFLSGASSASVGFTVTFRGVDERERCAIGSLLTMLGHLLSRGSDARLGRARKIKNLLIYPWRRDKKTIFSRQANISEECSVGIEYISNW